MVPWENNKKHNIWTNPESQDGHHGKLDVEDDVDLANERPSQVRYSAILSCCDLRALATCPAANHHVLPPATPLTLQRVGRHLRPHRPKAWLRPCPRDIFSNACKQLMEKSMISWSHKACHCQKLDPERILIQPISSICHLIQGLHRFNFCSSILVDAPSQLGQLHSSKVQDLLVSPFSMTYDSDVGGWSQIDLQWMRPDPPWTKSFCYTSMVSALLGSMHSGVWYPLIDNFVKKQTISTLELRFVLAI